MGNRLTISVPEVAKRLGISNPMAYQLVRRADFPSIQIGERRWVVYEAGLEKWIEEQIKRKGEAK